MAATPVTPIAGLVSEVTIGGEPVIVVAPGPNGEFIQNPAAASDQGLADAENLYVSPVGDATLEGNTTTFAIPPGESWFLIPGQTTPTSVNAPSNGHKFSIISY